MDEARLDTAPLYIRRAGTGPPVVLVHGGLSAEVTWGRRRDLESEWSLIIPSRRGYAPSPPAPRQDFLVDAVDLTALLTEIPGGAHLVGYSYGGLGACLAATTRPDLVRSLTLIETPLWQAGGESARRLMTIAERFAADANDLPAEHEFLALAGLTPEQAARPDIRASAALWRSLRSPREADPRWEVIAAAEIPALVISGAHDPDMEQLCDAVAARLGARRAHLPGAGHAVARAPGFDAVLSEFLAAAENRSGTS
ncbi:alpha/beta fold hydrolase [Nocardia sp. NPDC127579]|uniref:alpha/beta fold hydrolase n=1 Tax=Nocardia sp. NPDC127579 TaxID=3345402 RepID=UPI003642CFDB